MALIEMIMPKMGESIMEGTILTWLKKEGDRIEEDEAVLEVATDKVDTEVPATHAGVLRRILAQAGDVVGVGKPIAIIATEADAQMPTEPAAPAMPDNQLGNGDNAEESVAETSGPEAEKHADELESQIGRLSAPTFQMLDTPAAGRFYSPLVLTIAREENVSMQELERMPGSGGDNRVTKKDILQYVQSRQPEAGETTPPPATSGQITEPQEMALENNTSENSIPANPETSPADETLALIASMKATLKEEPEENTVRAEENTDAELLEAEPATPVSVPVEPVPEAAPVFQQMVEKEPVVEKSETVPPVPVPVQPPAVEMPPAAKPVEAMQPVSSPAVSYSGRAEIIEMDRMRKMIAQRMVDSVRIAPHVTSFVEADVTNIVFWRNRVKQEFKTREGDTITYTPVFIEAIAKAIKDYPMINSSVEGDKIIVKKDINIGMAVALPSGNLIVPVIKNADQYNLVGLTKKVNDLARRARESKLTADDLTDGTFTISNVGSFGNVMGTPIIMQPQVAIMAFGAVQKKPAVIETPFGDTLGIRHMMFLSHSYDHRVVDGSLGGMFVRRVADYLEAFDINRKIF